MKKNPISLYEKHHVNKQFERVDLFRVLRDQYEIRNALYPGSHVHITPSFIFPEVVFNDMYENLIEFFKSREIHEYILERKEYPEDPSYKYIYGDFREPLPLKFNSFDLLISQYAGFVSRACRQYLKMGGILVVNESHADASMAYISHHYTFIAVMNKRNSKFTHSTRNLDDYFIPNKDLEITVDFLDERKKGVGYTKTAMVYVFKKTR